MAALYSVAPAKGRTLLPAFCTVTGMGLKPFPYFLALISQTFRVSFEPVLFIESLTVGLAGKTGTIMLSFFQPWIRPEDMPAVAASASASFHRYPPL